jgi:hypothetical protein
MVEVRVRLEDESSSRRIFDCPYDHLDEVIPLIRAWGVSRDDRNESIEDMYGQFRIDDTSAYFEVVIGAAD